MRSITHIALVLVLLFTAGKVAAQADTTNPKLDSMIFSRLATMNKPYEDSIAKAKADQEAAAKAKAARDKRVADSIARIPKPRVKGPVVKKPKPIRTELSGGLRLNTDGWGIFVDKGWVKSEEKARDYFYDVKLLQVELQEKKHPAEMKRPNTEGRYSSDKPKAFIYGKANNFYAFKIGYGGRKMLAGKPEPGNVSMHLVYLGGISLGLLKPYYITAEAPLNSKDTNVVAVQDITWTDTTEKYFLNKSTIVGSAGFSTGLGEIKVVPGIHLKTALHFDFATSKTGVMAVETGVNLEFYSKAIELMATKDPRSLFFNAFVSIQFGKRW